MSFNAVLELDGSDNVNAVITRGPDMGGGIGGIISVNRGGKEWYFHYNHRGDVTAITNRGRKIKATYRYDAFGNLISSTGSVENPYRFSSKEYDEETGFCYFGFRYYAPSLGRFVSQDPLRYIDGLNQYTYARNNPLKYIDPFGLSTNNPGGNAFPAISSYVGKYDVFQQSYPPDWGNPVFNVAAVWVTWASNLSAIPFNVVSNVYNYGKDGLRTIGVSDDEIWLGEKLFFYYSATGQLQQGFTALRQFVPYMRYSVSEVSKARVVTRWNQFEHITSGQFATRAEAGQAWTAYKSQHRIITGMVRSSTAKSHFLKHLGQSGKAPKWMNQWLNQGKVPPGFTVDHIRPLSIGGVDAPSNMRLLDKAFHDLHHSPGFYRPWE